MIETNRNTVSMKINKINTKLEDLQGKERRAIATRVDRLNEQIHEDYRIHEKQERQVAGLKDDMDNFRGRVKALYTTIFQGTKEVNIRKNDLIRQIKGIDDVSSIV